jgi:hypothetical protein
MKQIVAVGAAPAAYPVEFEREVVCADGEPIRLRPVRVDDAPDSRT